MFNIHIKSLRIFCRALLVFSGVFLLCGTGFAQRSLVADQLMQEGKGAYQEGDYETAVPLFSKVLLIQPRNKEALEYLKKMGLDGGIYGYQRTVVDHIYDLMEEISLYQKDLQSLEEQSYQQGQQNEELLEQRRTLEALIAQKEEEGRLLKETHEEFYAVAAMRFKEQKEELSRLEETAQQKTQELVRLNTDLFETKQSLVSDRAALEERTSELTSVKKDFKEYQQLNDQQLSALKGEYENTILELEKRRDDLEYDMFHLTDDKNQQAKRFEDTLRRKSAELTLEQGRLATTSYQLIQQEERLLKAQEQIDVLYTQRAYLAQEAESLREAIRQLRQRKNFPYAYAPSDVKKDKLVAYVKKQDAQILDLKRRLAQIVGEVGSLEKKGEMSEQKMSDLKAQMNALQQEITDKERELEFSKEQAMSLEERVKDYQERLDTIEGMIKDKEERILLLEKELEFDGSIQK